jgi:type III secretion protein T
MVDYSNLNPENINNGLWIVLLCSARFYGAMAISPLFSDTYFSKMLKMILALMFSFIVFPFCYGETAIALPHSLVLKGILLLKEIVVGVIFGYLLSLPLWLIENVGNLIDLQRGEQFGAAINRTTQNPSSSISKLLLQGFITYLVSMNWFIFFIDTIFGSLKLIQINTLLPTSKFLTLNDYINFFSGYFYWVVIISLPVIFGMFLVDLIFGLVSSFIPQMNVTVLSMPLKSAVALMILVLFTGEIYHLALSKFFAEINLFGIHYGKY